MVSSACCVLPFTRVSRSVPPQKEATAARGLAAVSSDEELVARAQRGDRAAFQALFMAHRAQTSRLLSRLVPHNEIEDVAQEVFLQVHKSLSAFRGDARFSTWLYRLTLNVARMHLRRQKSRPKLNLQGQLSTHEDSSPLDTRTSDTPQLEAERHERLRALDRLLAQLSEKKRETLVLHDFQGVSAEEIAKSAKCP